MNTKTIAFVGNPNVGKSAWINALSHANFVIGNWPGVTIEKKTAIVVWQGITYQLIDLPGTYSLDNTSNEERITSEYLLHTKIDCIVNVIDVTNLQRNLYLTLLLRELQIPMMLLFNFMDEAKQYNIAVDVVKLSRRLQVGIVEASAYDTSQYEQVKTEIIETCEKQVCYYPVLLDHDYQAYVEMVQYFEAHVPSYVTMRDQQMALCIRGYLLGDKEMCIQVETWGMDEATCVSLTRPFTGEAMVEKRYQVIQSLMKYVHEQSFLRLRKTQKIDDILLHRYFGIPIFLTLFALMLLFVFHGSAPWNDFIQYLVHDYVGKYVYLLLQNMPIIIREGIVNGVIAGVGGVLAFVPLMTLLYAMLAILEESGYMARIAFLLDRAMRNFHLSGKSFVSLLLGFGCNVPAIYATRTLDNERQKRLTALLIPFMSCGARLPIYVLFAAAFFKHTAGLMIVTVYAIGILLALILAIICSHYKAFQDHALFVLELPPYRVPRFTVVKNKVKKEVQGYVKKATHVVLWAMIIIWACSYFPNGRIEDSYIASFGKTASVIYEPLGFGTRWESVASLPGSIVAKETVVGFLDQVLVKEKRKEEFQWDLANDTTEVIQTFFKTCKNSVLQLFAFQGSEPQSHTLTKQVGQLWTDPLAKLRAFCFMIYVLLSIPCVMTLQAIYREYGKRLVFLSITTMLVVPYVVTFMIFQFFSILLI